MTGEVGGQLGEHSDSVESIAICKSEASQLCVTCGIDVHINIYDIKKDYNLRQKITAAEYGGFSKVQFSVIDPHHFYASSTMGNILIIDVRNATILKTYMGHAAAINDFLEVVEHNILITAGDDFLCNVYDLTKEPQSKLLFDKIMADKERDDKEQKEREANEPKKEVKSKMENSRIEIKEVKSML